MNDRNERNLNPHKPAVMAICLFNRYYAAQSGGSMDFWAGLTTGEQQTCRDLVKRLEDAPPEIPRLAVLRRNRNSLARIAA